MAQKKATKETKAITKRQPAGVPANLSDAMETDKGKGFENMTANDLAIPFLVILQAMSPQVKRGEAQIADANEGDIFNTVTATIFDGKEGIFFVPAIYKKAWVEWTPRENGGGFVMQHEDESILTKTSKDDKNRDVLENGNIIVTTAYHYGLIIDPVTGEFENAVISMTSTQLKKSRKWNSVMSTMKMTGKDGAKFTPPMFAYMYKLTTVTEENEVGSWSGWNIEVSGQVPSADIYQAAKLFAENISKGVVRVATPQAPTEEVEF